MPRRRIRGMLASLTSAPLVLVDDHRVALFQAFARTSVVCRRWRPLTRTATGAPSRSTQMLGCRPRAAVADPRRRCAVPPCGGAASAGDDAARAAAWPPFVRPAHQDRRAAGREAQRRVTPAARAGARWSGWWRWPSCRGAASCPGCRLPARWCRSPRCRSWSSRRRRRHRGRVAAVQVGAHREGRLLAHRGRATWSRRR